jgi:hypothetical protein
MLETVKCELVGYLNPEMDKAEIIKKSFTRDPGAYKRMVKNLLPPSYEVKRRVRNKKTRVRGQSK